MRLVEKVRYFALVLIFLCIFVFHFPVQAAISLRSQVDTTLATIGDRIQVTITLNYPKGTVFRFPQLERETGTVEFVDQYFSEPRKLASDFERQWRLHFAVFDTGTVYIPALQIQAWQIADSTDVLSFSTDSIAIRVISVLPPGTTEPKDIKPPFAIRRIIPWDLVLFIGLVVGLIVGGMLYYRYWKRRHPQFVLDERFLEPPHVIAFRRLEELKNPHFKDDAELKQYYFQLSDILREYLERRYFIRALEMSTTEILDTLQVFALTPILLDQFKVVFGWLDLVKFAKHIPQLTEVSKVWEHVYQCINLTKREPFLNRRLT
jgi:hypothetical protein